MMRRLMMRSLHALSICLLMLLGSAAVTAQQVASGDFVLHYAAIPTLQLTPDVARQYGLTRSSGRALLNIAIRQRDGSGGDRAVTATVTASATNSAGQRQDLRLREVREGDAIYYLAEARVSDGETLRFEVDARVEGAVRPLSARFSQPFYTR
jgi:hypothetical protein